MAMSEIWVSEAMVCLFLVLPLFRPLVKALWPLDGLGWLPFVALIIMVGIFLAYGFRPECLPMLIFALIYSAANFSAFISSVRSRSNDAFRDRSNLLTAFAFIILGAGAFVMFAFSPRLDFYPEPETKPVRLLKIYGGSYGRDYYLQIYGPSQADRPIIFLIPPEIGSSASVKFICLELEKKGYTVVTYSRKDFDFPFVDENEKKHFSLLAKMPGYLYASGMGDRFASANDRGKAMEAERQADIEYLLPRIHGLLIDTKYGELPPILLVGYGAGGSALIYLNGNGGFASYNNNVLGIVAVESRLWSLYQTEASGYKARYRGGYIQRKLFDIVDRLPDLLPKMVKRTVPLPSADLPVLHLVSGRAGEALKYRQSDFGGGRPPYQVIFDILRSASSPTVLVAVKDSGPLDYQDFPLTHPVFSFSLMKPKDAENIINDTAGIIGNFASLLLEQSGQPEPENDDFWQPGTNIPPRSPINSSLYIESRGMAWLKL